MVELTVRRMSRPDDCSICFQKMVLPFELSCHHKYCFLCIKGVNESLRPPLCPMCRDPIDDRLFRNPRQHFSLDMADPEMPLTPRRLPQTPSTTPKMPPAMVKVEDNSEDKQTTQVVADSGQAGLPPNTVPDQENTPKSVVVKAEVKQEPDATRNAYRTFWLYQGRGGGWWRFDPRLERDLEEHFKAHNTPFDMVIVGHPYRMDLMNLTQTRLDALGGQPIQGRIRCLRRIDSVHELHRLPVKGIAGVRTV